MRRTLLTSVVLALLLAGSTRAAELSDLEATAAMSDQAMKLIASNRVVEAFDLLGKYWPIPSPDLDAMAHRLSGERAQAIRHLGASLSVEPVGIQTMGDSFIQYVYLEKLERTATVWVFRFYKPKSGWIVTELMPLSRFDGLFQWQVPSAGLPAGEPASSL